MIFKLIEIPFIIMTLQSP